MQQPPGTIVMSALASRPEPQVARSTAFLHAGRIFVSSTPHAVTTILGSCVAVCLWDESSGVGGLNHFLLPDIGGMEDSPKCCTGATRMLIEQLCAAGARKVRLRAKVFGGSAMTDSRQDPLGPKNATLAFEQLAAWGIPVVAQDVRGTRGRKLIFHTDDGTALVKLL